MNEHHYSTGHRRFWFVGVVPAQKVIDNAGGGTVPKAKLGRGLDRVFKGAEEDVDDWQVRVIRVVIFSGVMQHVVFRTHNDVAQPAGGFHVGVLNVLDE